LEILSLLGQRLTNKEISGNLYISPETVKRHASSIFKKLEVNGRREAVTKAISLNILS
jgi:DNA-binding CsgD family transcriptional regulator